MPESIYQAIGAGAQRPLRIVTLDDDEFFAEAMANAIQRWRADVELVWFSDAALAWQELERMPPDIFVTDFYGGSPTGEEMLTSLAEQKVKFAVLVISGFATEEDVLRCADGQLNCSFLSKPWAEHRLAEKLSRLSSEGSR